MFLILYLQNLKHSSGHYVYIECIELHAAFLLMEPKEISNQKNHAHMQIHKEIDTKHQIPHCPQTAAQHPLEWNLKIPHSFNFFMPSERGNLNPFKTQSQKSFDTECKNSVDTNTRTEHLYTRRLNPLKIPRERMTC